MAGGFGKGFIHGLGLAAVGLLTAGLILPAPFHAPQVSSVAPTTDAVDRVPVTAAESPDTPAAPVGEPSGKHATSNAEALSDSASPDMARPDPARPDPASVGGADLPLPAGSEFRRGDDRLPQPPAAPGPLPGRDLPAAPRVVATDAEPMVTADPALRPAAPVIPEAPPAPRLVESDRDSLPAPPVETPIPVAPPGRVVTPDLDRRPELANVAQDSGETARPQAPNADAAATHTTVMGQPTADAPVAPSAQEQPAPKQPTPPTPAHEVVVMPTTQAPHSASPNTMPDLVRPAPDLTVPPDLSGLRLLDKTR